MHIVRARHIQPSSTILWQFNQTKLKNFTNTQTHRGDVTIETKMRSGRANQAHTIAYRTLVARLSHMSVFTVPHYPPGMEAGARAYVYPANGF